MGPRRRPPGLPVWLCPFDGHGLVTDSDGPHLATDGIKRDDARGHEEVLLGCGVFPQ